MSDQTEITATQKHIDELKTALEDANGLCRTAYQIAMRDGAATNWQGFRDSLLASLKRQHAVMYPVSPRPPVDS